MTRQSNTCVQNVVLHGVGTLGLRTCQRQREMIHNFHSNTMPSFARIDRQLKVAAFVTVLSISIPWLQ